MIFDLIKHAKQLLFDDSKAKIGTNNVQGAIESVKSDVDSVKTDLDAVEEETVYCGEGDSYMRVNSSGEIVKYTVPENASRVITVSTKTVLQEHDNVLEKLNITKANKEWKSIGTSNGYLTTEWTTSTCVNMSFAKEVLILARYYANVIGSITIPYGLFQALKEDGVRAIMQTNYGDLEIKFVNHTQLQMKFTNADNKYMQANIYAR